MALVIESHFGCVKLLAPVQHHDPRGFLSETYNRKALQDAGIDVEFVQDNHSLSRTRGLIRGLHFQAPPFAQAKLVRVVRGRILDIAVDIRRGSEHFGKHVAVELSAENWRQLFVPVGFAHGFCSLEPDTEVFYKVDNHYSAEHDRGLKWNDPQLGIAWPVDETEAQLSDKDRRWPPLAELDSPFHL